MPRSSESRRRLSAAIDDVLKARLKTVGVVEHAFLLTQGHTRGMNWKIYDVGGARNQRQAWAPYFQDGEPRFYRRRPCADVDLPRSAADAQ